MGEALEDWYNNDSDPSNIVNDDEGAVNTGLFKHETSTNEILRNNKGKLKESDALKYFNIYEKKMTPEE